MGDFFIACNGQQSGPYPEAEIQKRLSGNQIQPTDLCWTEGMAKWKPVSEVFQSEAAPPPIPGAPLPQTLPRVPSTPLAKASTLWNSDAIANGSRLLTQAFGVFQQVRNLVDQEGDDLMDQEDEDLEDQEDEDPEDQEDEDLENQEDEDLEDQEDEDLEDQEDEDPENQEDEDPADRKDGRKPSLPTDSRWVDGMAKWKSISAVFQGEAVPPLPSGAPPLPKIPPPAPSAPAVRIENAPKPQNGTLVADPKKLAAGRGLDWWKEAWRLFRKATGLWIGIGIALLLIFVVLGLIHNLIPYADVQMLFSLALTLAFPTLFAVLMFVCHSLDSGGDLNFGHLLANRLLTNRLLMIGTLSLFGSLAITALSGSGGFSVVLEVLLGFFLGWLIYFAPTLVVLHGLPVVEAIKLSLRGCLRNIPPLLLYGLVGVVLGIFAILPVGLGLLVFIPVLLCGLYIVYRDIFTNGRDP
jgi:hypothetical protein